MGNRHEILDPRPVSRVVEEEKLISTPTLGVEVTVANFAKLCILGNVDPQHTSGRTDLSAIEGVTSLLRGEAQVATVRPDLDSLGSMAVLDIAMDAIQKARVFEEDILERIELIGSADRFERGGWKPAVLPTREQPWPSGAESAESSRQLAAMGSVVSDRDLAVDERIRLLKIWLLIGEEPTEYREKVERERLDLIRALEDGSIGLKSMAGGRISAVESTHKAALMVGYSASPVVVARNPQFRLKDGEPHNKFTIAQFEPGYADLKATLSELSEIEPGWGGSPTIGGSPQGVSSNLSTEHVVAVAERHLLK